MLRAAGSPGSRWNEGEASRQQGVLLFRLVLDSLLHSLQNQVLVKLSCSYCAHSSSLRCALLPGFVPDFQILKRGSFLSLRCVRIRSLALGEPGPGEQRLYWASKVRHARRNPCDIRISACISVKTRCIPKDTTHSNLHTTYASCRENI